MPPHCSLGPDGKRQYTLKKATSSGVPTRSAHPGMLPRSTSNVEHADSDLRTARFSPDDKYSRHRVTIKKRCVLPFFTLVSRACTVLTPHFIRSQSACTFELSPARFPSLESVLTLSPAAF